MSDTGSISNSDYGDYSDGNYSDGNYSDGDGDYGYGNYGDDDGDSAYDFYGGQDEVNPLSSIYTTTFDQKLHSSEQNDCGAISIKSYKNEAEYRRAIGKLDPETRLKQMINTIVYTLNDKNILNISAKTRNFICSSINIKLGNVYSEYLNPLGVVLGYYAYEEGFLIEEGDTKFEIKNKVKNMKTYLFDKLDDIRKATNTAYSAYSVYEPDIIKYARLWSKV